MKKLLSLIALILFIAITSKNTNTSVIKIDKTVIEIDGVQDNIECK